MRILSKKNPLPIIAIICFWASNYVYVPVLSPYCEQIGATPVMIGMILASYGFVQNLLRLPLGIASDYFKRSKVFLLIAFSFCVISNAGFLLYPVPAAALICRSLSGTALSCWAIFVSFFCLCSNYSKERALALSATAMVAGQFVGTFLGGVIASFAAAEISFIAGILLSFVGLVITCGLTPVNKEEDPLDQTDALNFRTVINLVKYKPLLVFSLVSAVNHYLTTAVFTGFLPTLLEQCGAGLPIQNFGSCIAMLPGCLGARFSVEASTAKKRLLGSLVMLSFPMFLIPYVKSSVLLCVLILVSGFGRGMSYSMTMTLAVQQIPTKIQTTALAAYQAIYGIGMWLGPAVTGVIYEQCSLSLAVASTGVVGMGTVLLLSRYDFQSQIPFYYEQSKYQY